MGLYNNITLYFWKNKDEKKKTRREGGKTKKEKHARKLFKKRICLLKRCQMKSPQNLYFVNKLPSCFVKQKKSPKNILHRVKKKNRSIKRANRLFCVCIFCFGRRTIVISRIKEKEPAQLAALDPKKLRSMFSFIKRHGHPISRSSKSLRNWVGATLNSILLYVSFLLLKETKDSMYLSWSLFDVYFVMASFILAVGISTSKYRAKAQMTETTTTPLTWYSCNNGEKTS